MTDFQLGQPVRFTERLVRVRIHTYGDYNALRSEELLQAAMDRMGISRSRGVTTHKGLDWKLWVPETFAREHLHSGLTAPARTPLPGPRMGTHHKGQAMNIDLSDEAVQLASVGILKHRHREQESKRNQEQVYAIYANATPTPEDAHPAVKIVERVFKEHVLATALFHANEAARFKAALIEAEGLES